MTGTAQIAQKDRTDMPSAIVDQLCRIEVAVEGGPKRMLVRNENETEAKDGQVKVESRGFLREFT